jgi:hypothetical protein
MSVMSENENLSNQMTPCTASAWALLRRHHSFDIVLVYIGWQSVLEVSITWAFLAAAGYFFHPSH